jgi:hypothetical protein
MVQEWRPRFGAELQRALDEAVRRLREKADVVYGSLGECEKLADLHFLAHELVDDQLGEIAAADPGLSQAALLDLREQIGRYVHRVIERTRRC